MTKKRNLLILILIFAIALLAFTSCSEKPKLSELEDEELLQCIADAEIGFNEDFANAETLRFWIRWVENCPSSMAPDFDDEVVLERFEEIRKFVFEYYDGEIPEQTGEPLLSHLEDEELVQYIIDAGLEIPTNNNAAHIRSLILHLEEDINYEQPLSSGIFVPTLPHSLAEAIRTLVREYS